MIVPYGNGPKTFRPTIDPCKKTFHERFNLEVSEPQLSDLTAQNDSKLTHRPDIKISDQIVVSKPLTIANF